MKTEFYVQNISALTCLIKLVLKELGLLKSLQVNSICDLTYSVGINPAVVECIVV